MSRMVTSPDRPKPAAPARGRFAMPAGGLLTLLLISP